MNIQSAPKPSIRNLFDILFKRKKVILLFFFLSLCAALGAALLMKPVYRATAQLLFKPGREDIPITATDRILTAVRFDREEQINSEIEIIRSRSLLEKTLQSIGLTSAYTKLLEIELESGIQGPDLEKLLLDRAVMNLQRDLQVEGVRRSGVIELRLDHTDPHMAALILNRLCDLLLEHHLQVHKKHDSYDFFERQFELLRANLTETEKKLQGFRAKHHISSLVEQRSLLLRQLADLRNQLDLTLIQEVELRHRIKEFNQVLLDTPETVAQGEEIDHNPYIISSLQTRLVELELKQNDLLTKYNEESRLVRNTREEIEIVRQKLQEQEGKRYGKSQYGLNPTYQGLRESLLRNMAELKATAAKRQTQETQLASYEDNLRGLNSLESELKQLQYEADVALESFRLYQKKREESRISQAMDSDKIVNFSIMEAAIPPLRPVKPNINLILLIGIIFGLIGSFFLALTLEYIRDTLERPEEVEDFLRLPVLASIPELRSGGKFALLRSVQIRHPASAA